MKTRPSQVKSIDPKYLKAPGKKTCPSVANQPNKLMDALWRSLDSCHQISVRDPETNNFGNFPLKSVDEATKRALSISNTGKDVYFACAEYLTQDNRRAGNASGAYAFWLDIDCGKEKAQAGKGYESQELAREALSRFCADAGLPEPTNIVNPD